MKKIDLEVTTSRRKEERPHWFTEEEWARLESFTFEPLLSAPSFLPYTYVPWDCHPEGVVHNKNEQENNKMPLKNTSNFKYKKIICNKPATIILWGDGTKTVVKCSPDREYDPYSGVAICFMKKALGNKNGHRNKKFMKDINDAINAQHEEAPGQMNLFLEAIKGALSGDNT